MFVGQFWTILDFGRSGTSPGSNATPAVIEKFRKKRNQNGCLSLCSKSFRFQMMILGKNFFLKCSFLPFYIILLMEARERKGKEGKGRKGSRQKNKEGTREARSFLIFLGLK